MTSSALLASVAESTVILAPISHVGCSSASVGPTSWKRSAGRVRKGPPDAVSTTRRTSSTGRPARHWCTAPCSLSTGRSSPPPRRSASMTSAPPATSDSLLASASLRPASSAAIVGSSPATPTSPFTTTSLPGAEAAATRASRPTRHSPRQRGRKEASGSSASTTNSGSSSQASASSPAASRRAVSATARKRCGWRPMTRSVERPIEPVAPRMTTPRTGALQLATKNR